MTSRFACGILILSLALLNACGPPDRQSSDALIGHWLGNVSYRDATVRFEFDIERSGDSLVAYFTSDEMLVRARPIGRVSFDKPRVQFVIPDERVPLTFDGWLRRNLIVGTLTSAALPNPERKATLPQLSLRHTHPSMFPYRVETLESARNRLYRPSLQGPYPAVVLVSDPRRPLAVSLDAYADRFARAGFAALVLESERDVAQAFKSLRARRDVDVASSAMFRVAVAPESVLVEGEPGSVPAERQRRAFGPGTVLPSAGGAFEWPREAPGVIDSMITWMRARSLER